MDQMVEVPEKSREKDDNSILRATPTPDLLAPRLVLASKICEDISDVLITEADTKPAISYN